MLILLIIVYYVLTVVGPTYGTEWHWLPRSPSEATSDGILCILFALYFIYEKIEEFHDEDDD